MNALLPSFTFASRPLFSLTHWAKQYRQVDQRVKVKGMRAVLVQVGRDDVVHNKVDRRALPVRPVHGQVPELGPREMAEIEGVEEKEGEECGGEAGQEGGDAEVEHLEGREVRVGGDAALQPEEDGRGGEGDERGAVEDPGDNERGDGEEVLEVVVGDELFLPSGRDLDGQEFQIELEARSRSASEHFTITFSCIVFAWSCVSFNMD